MTQSEFIDLVNLNIADNSNIVPAKHREVEIALSNEVYANRSVIELQQILITNLLKFMPKNRGWVGNIDIGAGSPSFTIGGDTIGVTSVSSSDGTSVFTVEFANEMPSINYMVKPFMEVESGIILQAAKMPIISKIDTTHFQLAISENSNFTQDLRLNYEIISLD